MILTSPSMERTLWQTWPSTVTKREEILSRISSTLAWLLVWSPTHLQTYPDLKKRQKGSRKKTSQLQYVIIRFIFCHIVHHFQSFRYSLTLVQHLLLDQRYLQGEDLVLCPGWVAGSTLKTISVSQKRGFRVPSSRSSMSQTVRRQSWLSTTKILPTRSGSNNEETFMTVLPSQVKMMEIFDVTETDPSLLVKDQLDYMDALNLRFILFLI